MRQVGERIWLVTFMLASRATAGNAARSITSRTLYHRCPTHFGRFVEHYDVALNKLIDAQLARLS